MHANTVLTVRGWVGDHEGCEVLLVQEGHGLQLLHVHVALLVSADGHDTHAGHDSAGRVGAVGRHRDDAHVAVVVTAGPGERHAQQRAKVRRRPQMEKSVCDSFAFEGTWQEGRQTADDN